MFVILIGVYLALSGISITNYIKSKSISSFIILDKDKNYFELLDLKSSLCSLTEINDNYEILRVKHNPAFNIDPSNLSKFKEIQEAYDCLKFP